MTKEIRVVLATFTVFACIMSYHAGKAFGSVGDRLLAARFCATMPMLFYADHHRMVPASCRFVRTDSGANEPLYRVYVWDVTAHWRHLWTDCLYADGEEETAWERVSHVGQTNGTLC